PPLAEPSAAPTRPSGSPRGERGGSEVLGIASEEVGDLLADVLLDEQRELDRALAAGLDRTAVEHDAVTQASGAGRREVSPQPHPVLLPRARVGGRDLLDTELDVRQAPGPTLLQLLHRGEQRGVELLAAGAPPRQGGGKQRAAQPASA